MQQNDANDELITVEEQARHHPGNSTNSTVLAQAYAARGQWQEAIEAYRSALALDGDNADLYDALGTAYKHVGDLEPAEEAYRKAITLQPDHATAYLNLGMLFEEQTRIPEAIRAFKKCLELSSDPDESSAARKNLQVLLRKYPEADKPEPRTAPAPETYALMQREIRSWGYWSLGLGAVHLIASGFLNASWGILLLIVGAASFYFRESPMFIIYGVTLAWVAISNMLSGGGTGWLVFGISQLYLAYTVFRQYHRFHHAEAEIDKPPGPSRAAGIFPQLGCLLSALAFGGVATLIIGAMISGAMGIVEIPSVWYFVTNVFMNLAVLGLAVGLAALLSKYRYKPLTILGMVGSTLVLLLEIVLRVTP